MAVSITKKPTLAVSKLGAPTRVISGNNKYIMRAEWKIPKDLVSTKKNNRATGLEIDWMLGIDGTDPKKVVKTTNEQTTTAQINLNNLVIGSKTYTRNSFYPKTKTKLSYVTVQVVPTNSKGKGKAAKQTRKFAEPKAPTIDEWEFNANTGSVSTTVKTDAGDGYYERLDTKYVVEVDNRGTVSNASDSFSASTEFNLSYNAQNYQQLSYDEFIRVTAKAFSRGFAGNSKEVTRTIYVSYPAQPNITSVDVSSRDSTGKCTVYVDTNATTEHPVDRVKLEYLADVEYDTAENIPAGASWTETEIIDDDKCTALAIPVASLVPSRGKHTWVRVKAYHLSENVLYRYSNYMMVEQLETPAATSAQIDIDILSATAGQTGESAVVRLGWNKDGLDDYTGTELSWSEDENTWKSTEEPHTHEFTWTDGQVTEGGVTYHDSASITIKGLSEGTKYFIKARRYLDGDSTSYSAYSNTATCVTSEAPESIVASCDKYVVAGSSLPVSWTLSGKSLQTEWQIVDSNGTVIANGKGRAGATQIDADRISAFAANNELTFSVQASTGSGFVTSEMHTVTVVERPTLSVSATDVLTAQPFSFTATCSKLCDLIVIVTSQGASGQLPQGFAVQTAGDTIYSGLHAPAWTASGGAYTATVEIPNGLDFWDLTSYTLSVVAKDRNTGLKSDAVITEFSIDWTNKAVDPSEAVTLTVLHEADEDGDYRRAVQINLTAPANCNGTDVYDIYRMDGGKAHLIGESFPLTFTTVDEYAPFGDDIPLFYRVAIRTVDGDTEFADIEYTAECKSLRFDWADGFLEVPYGLAIGDSYKKDVDIRHHMDGSVDGYWNPNIERTASLNTDIIKIVQPAEIDMARKLARHAGAVFVRTPNGSAYEADVQVKDVSVKNIAVTSIAIDATEIGLTQEFMLPIPYELP